MIHDESTKVQEFVHRLEVGGLKKVVLIGALFAALAGLASLFLFFNFCGLDSETAMDQAQVGRQIAAGAGYSTLYIRPMAMWQFLNHQEKMPEGYFPDTYNFPLNPVINAVLLRPIKRWWPMQATDIVYVGDRIIAAAGIALFFASAFVTFFLVRRLFDSKIAWMTIGLIFLSDMMWRFSVSGLPQMLMLFFFSVAMYLFLTAVEAREENRLARQFIALAGVALLLALMTLASPLASWIFLGFAIFVFAWFRQRVLSGLLVILIFSLVVSPWLVRNYLVCGNPLGLTMYSVLDGTSGSELSFMSNLQPDLRAFGMVRAKLRAGFSAQFENFFSFFGYSLTAIAFFFSLLHIYKRSTTNMFRWALALMWFCAAFGMVVFTPRGQISANQLHMLFLPLFIAFGLAFLIVLWNRLNLRFEPAKIAFLILIFLVSALPLAVNLLTQTHSRVNWPPYVPPFINSISNWMEPGEIMVTDMPWAVAWYGGRPTLLLPSTAKQFITIHDYKYLGGPLNGLYLTPVSGNRPFLSQIAKGEYREWAPFIMRTADLTRFPLQFFTPLPVDNECVFYSNRDRWSPTQ